MSRIKIKNFGPIREGLVDGDGFIDIKKVTVFIGGQGTGKSTVAKLISSLMEYEKTLFRIDSFFHDHISLTELILLTQRYEINNLFDRKETEIDFQGELISIKLGDEPRHIATLKKNALSESFRSPIIVYIPAERNFFSAINAIYDVSNLPKHLHTFGETFKRAQIDLGGTKISLPLEGLEYQYDIQSNISGIFGQYHAIKLERASSGLHSIVPLFIVSKVMAESVAIHPENGTEPLSINQKSKRNDEIASIMLNKSLTIDQKEELVQEISNRYSDQCFINIVEEPEQNLFPSSQGAILNSLLHFNNMNADNQLLMTTHSPYIVNYLSIAIQGKSLLKKIEAAGRDDLKERLNAVVPLTSLIDGADVAIYQFDKDGTIRLLPNFEGIPSDNNYLNNSLAEGNELFGTLLDIEQEL